eukprot:scaffold86_cov338-Pavlova_lutheri.AAC.27
MAVSLAFLDVLGSSEGDPTHHPWVVTFTTEGKLPSFPWGIGGGGVRPGRIPSHGRGSYGLRILPHPSNG